MLLSAANGHKHKATNTTSACEEPGDLAPIGLAGDKQAQAAAAAANFVAASSSSPIANSFSFNSYQDILCGANFCSAPSSPSRSSFAASELSFCPRHRRTSELAFNCSHSKFRVQRKQRHLQQLHRRQKFISPEEEGNLKNHHLNLSHSRIDTQTARSVVHFSSPAASSSKQTNATMSQTMQSIQSLSMQLNRASLSHCELNSLAGFQPIDVQAAEQANSINASSKLSRLLGKKVIRAKELLLQNLGKADKTIDEMFKLYEENFYKQQAHALKLQKEFKNYVTALKAAHEADKSLNNCIQHSTSDYQSARHDLVCENLSQMEHLNEDLMDKLRSQVMLSIEEYLSKFGELREKISKRRRKLIDYDSSRRIYELMLNSVNKKRIQHQQQQKQSPLSRSIKSALMLSSTSSLANQHQNETLQSATNQLVDEARLLKLREQYNYCKIMYETINGELHEELPMVYEKKMKHLLMTLQNYFSLEAQFHSNAGKLFATASDVIDELPMSLHNHQHYLNNKTTRHSDDEEEFEAGGARSTGVLDGSSKIASGSSGMGSSRGESSLESSSSPDNSSCNELPVKAPSVDGSEHDEEEEVVVDVVEEPAEIEAAGKEEAGDEWGAGFSLASEHGAAAEAKAEPSGGELESCEITVEEINSIAEAASPDGAPVGLKVEEPQVEETAKVCAEIKEEKAPKMLYKVKTSYKYLAEDVDELCFEADEIIQVIEFEEVYEQEEGWLLGIREVNGQKGLFPANFTQLI